MISGTGGGIIPTNKKLPLPEVDSWSSMNFAEVRSWELLLGGLLVDSCCCARSTALCATPDQRTTFDKSALLALGLSLLLAVGPLTFGIFLAVAVGTYAGLKRILHHSPSSYRHYQFILIPLQLLPLAYFKYANFIGNTLLGLDAPSLRDIAIPVGISFYTFQKVAFVVDTLDYRQPLPPFLDYMNFAGFFPQIVAGPIERRGNLLPQMQSFRFRWNADDINEGARWLALGFFFKCALADNFAQFVD